MMYGCTSGTVGAEYAPDCLPGLTAASIQRLSKNVVATLLYRESKAPSTIKHARFHSISGSFVAIGAFRSHS
ncbi:MAG: hypothetical protein N2663_09090 [Chlorobi bacterium]|nr:hypothetical protein [Chlorobiota bacterium]